MLSTNALPITISMSFWLKMVSSYISFINTELVLVPVLLYRHNQPVRARPRLPCTRMVSDMDMTRLESVHSWISGNGNDPKMSGEVHHAFIRPGNTWVQRANWQDRNETWTVGISKQPANSSNTSHTIQQLLLRASDIDGRSARVHCLSKAMLTSN
jgi:hypothetical protein